MPKPQEDILISIVVASVFFILICSFLLLIVFIFLRRQRKNREEKDEMKNRFEQTLLKTQLEIQEQAFAYISQEIHDNIGQILSLVRLNLNTFGSVVSEEKMEQTDKLLGKAIKDLRDLSHNLQKNRIYDIGIVESIRQLLQSLEKTGRYITSFQTSDHYNLLDTNTDIILYRMIQEIVNNIIKHAAATKIDIEINSEVDLTTIRISDNGIGFDTALLQKERAGIGLQNIINRAKTIDANVDVKSEQGKGTTITLYIKPKPSLL
ncbi:MAG: ATP-binding protein [Bacteroidota bacterium]